MPSYPALVEDGHIHEAFAASFSMRILAYRRLSATAAYTSDNMTAPFNRIYIIQSGHVRISNGNKSWRFQAGDVCLIPLNSAFSCAYSADLKKTYVHFRLEFIPGSDVCEALDSCHRIATADEKQLDMLSDFSDASALIFVSVKAQLMLWLSRYMHTENITPHNEREIYHKYKNVFNNINTGERYNHSVSELADVMNMSISNFSRSFSKDTGISPKAYLNKRLTEHAQYRLLSNDHAIADIAHSLAFDDEHYFSRFFKKQTGMSPKEYRKTHQGIL